MSQLRAMQTEAVDRGTLQINVTSSVNAFPVERAEISISYTGVPESTLEKIQTDSSGQTETIELAAPPEEWSLDIEEDRQPYSEYTLSIKAPGFEPVNIAGTEILANVKAIQNIQMKPADVSGEEDQVFAEATVRRSCTLPGNIRLGGIILRCLHQSSLHLRHPW